MKLLLTHACVITSDSVLKDHALLLEDGVIRRIAPSGEITAPAGTQLLDAQGAYAAPGFIDMHIHGFAGFGPEEGTEESLLNMSLALKAYGVTAFCPTLYCGQPDAMERILRQTAGALGKEQGARILGYHLEGPFISPRKPGVMKPQDIAPVNLQILERLYAAARGKIVSMTAAPELPGMEAVIRFCREKHILLQAGHTDASYEQFLRTAREGITHTTHLFNAMSAFNHRAPGAAGAALMHPEISAEIIADGAHVHPDVVTFLKRVKPVENIVLVTDALKPTAQTVPPFMANGEEVLLQDGVWKRKQDGVIAGSALTMLKGVQNLTRFGFTLPEAVRCASANPARLLGLAHKGALAEGVDADVTLFTPDFQPLHTFTAHTQNG